MYWKEFEATLAEKPKLQSIVKQFSVGISELLSQHPDAVLDSEQLGQSLEIGSDAALDFLILLEKDSMVKIRLFWECSNGLGTSKEADAAVEFPPFIECDRCGEVHEFDQDCVSVHFIATPTFIESIAEAN